MDHRLMAWARAVKARQGRGGPPVLWLFTDAGRLADPALAIASLPRSLAGVVFRHDDAADRAVLAGRVARLCRQRGLPLVIAGDVRLAVALGAGVHLRRGRWPGLRLRVRGLVTSSAHDGSELRRAVAAGASIVFVSPALATRSHPDGAGLGMARWAALTKRHPAGMFALGGIDGLAARRLPGWCGGVGAIGALLP